MADWFRFERPPLMPEAAAGASDEHPTLITQAVDATSAEYPTLIGEAVDGTSAEHPTLITEPVDRTSPEDPTVIAEPVDRTNPETTALIEVRDLARGYRVAESVVWALRGVSFRIAAGEDVAIIGPSGSGKSTLLHILGLLDRPSAGTYRFAGLDTATLSDDNLARLRNRAIGFVFQSFNLVAGESALENVAAPLVYAGVRRRERHERAAAALERVGLANRMRHDPSQLSGGQRQRVAIARALVTNPPLLLADEPTGNLDSVASEDVLGLLGELRDQGLTVLTITHDARIAARAGRVLEIGDGRLVRDERAVVAA